jgi:hypothetical protein
MITGRCLCQAIRYECAGEPILIAHCHCESCRRQTSSPMTTFILVPRATLRFTRGQPKEFSSSQGVWRSFCADCGSPIYYRTDRRPNDIDLYAVTLDDAAGIAPECHVHSAEQLPWFEVSDDLPRYPGSSRSDPPLRQGARQSG